MGNQIDVNANLAGNLGGRGAGVDDRERKELDKSTTTS